MVKIVKSVQYGIWSALSSYLCTVAEAKSLSGTVDAIIVVLGLASW